MAESDDVWKLVPMLAEAFEQSGSSALNEFAEMPAEVQEQSLKQLAQMSVASAALVAQATSHLAMKKSK